MARGKDERNNPSRVPVRPGWKGLSTWYMHGPLGEVTSVYDYNMGESHQDEGIEAAVWKGEKGHTAEVQEHYWEPRAFGRGGEIEQNTFEAGPFKTSYRAQVAAESLARRVHRGKAEGYQS